MCTLLTISTDKQGSFVSRLIDMDQHHITLQTVLLLCSVSHYVCLLPGYLASWFALTFHSLILQLHHLFSFIKSVKKITHIYCMYKHMHIIQYMLQIAL